MKVSLPTLIVLIVTGVTLLLAACKNEDPSKDAKKKSSVMKEKTEQEVQYWLGKATKDLSLVAIFLRIKGPPEYRRQSEGRFSSHKPCKSVKSLICKLKAFVT